MWTPLLALCLTVSLTTVAHATTTPVAIYDQALGEVQRGFHDPSLRGLPWAELVAAGRRELGTSPSAAGLKRAITGVLGQLGPAAPRYFDDKDQAFWMLVGAASGRLDGGRIRQIGAWFERRGKRWFVRDIFFGSPADQAGLARGDEIVSVDGRELEPVRSFRDARPGSKVKVLFKRVPWETPRDVDVDTVVESFAESMSRAMRRSYRVIEAGTMKIAYVWLPATTHGDLHGELRALIKRAQAEGDALVLDLRGDFGGMGATPFEEFVAPPGVTRPPPFTKKMAVLVDHGTSSGKERLASLIQSQGRGQLIGRPTQGFALAGKVMELEPRRSLLYLGVKGPTPHATAQGEQSLTPDVQVPSTFMYAAGGDEDLKAALIALAAKP